MSLVLPNLLIDDYRIVYPQLDGNRTSYHLGNRQNVPYSLFIEPPYSNIGLRETEAIKQGYEIKIA